VLTIKRLRKKVLLTQESLAERINVDRSTVAKWETGASFPRTDMLPKLAEILGCTIDALFDSDETVVQKEGA
jgi:transcriptional regulator with XRE-family HTH domain